MENIHPYIIESEWNNQTEQKSNNFSDGITINYRTIENLTKIHFALTESEFNNRIDSIFLFERSRIYP